MLLDADVVQPQKSGVGKFVFAVCVVGLLLAAGAWQLNRRHSAHIARAAAHKVERERIVLEKDRIVALCERIGSTRAELVAITEQNSKPTRKGGKPISQDKWSSEAQQRYANVQKDVERMTASRSERIDQLTRLLAAYHGPWPHDQKPDFVLTCPQLL
jgi:hypothetical protein